MGSKGTLGILNPFEGFKHFSLKREAPSDDLAAFVEGFWSVRWDLDAGASFEQEILAYPCVNLSTAAGGFEVHGPGRQRFAAQLTGSACVCGTKAGAGRRRIGRAGSDARQKECRLENSATALPIRSPRGLHAGSEIQAALREYPAGALLLPHCGCVHASGTDSGAAINRISGN